VTVELDTTGARVLDAAVQVLVDFGFECATVDLVVKYAGVSHTAVYRRWPAKNALLGAAVLREFNTIFDAAVRRLDDRATFEDKVIGAFTAVVWSVRNHPLMTRELKIEPETVLPFLTTSSGPAMQTALAFVADRLRGWAQASGLELDDPEALADIVVRLAHSVLLVPQPTRPLDTRIDIENYAQRYLGPLTRSALGVDV
jgi:AcrR family transcriptional regulator